MHKLTQHKAAAPLERTVVAVANTRAQPGRADAPLRAYRPAERVTPLASTQACGGTALNAVRAGMVAGPDGPRRVRGGLRDSDDDGLSDEAELNIFGTDPHNADTDGDGISDGEEVLIWGTDPGRRLIAPLAQEQFVYAAHTALDGLGGWLLNSGTSATVAPGNLDVPGLAFAAGNCLTWATQPLSLIHISEPTRPY